MTRILVRVLLRRPQPATSSRTPSPGRSSRACRARRLLFQNRDLKGFKTLPLITRDRAQGQTGALLAELPFGLSARSQKRYYFTTDALSSAPSRRDASSLLFDRATVSALLDV